MYRVIIIDDEPIIVRGLSKVIDWGAYDCEVVATAGNGKEGMEMIRKYQADIIFSDIAMPGMDGLQMIAGLKSEYEDLEICILTGYRDFDFAQQAVNLGVTRFLLKPSDMAELNEAVKTMTENLDKKRKVSARKEDGSREDTEQDMPDKTVPAEAVSSATAAMEEAGTTSNTEKPAGAANCFIVKNALTYLEEHYAEKITLSDLADKVYVSQWHLSKLLNRQMGQNFSEILNTIRINRAKELLRTPSLRIADVAEEVGFLDVAHFSKVFKKLEGMSANEYRNTVL